MKDCYFGLIRHYLRVDDVLIRIYDTRIFHDFSTDYILREFQSRQNTYLELTQKGFHFDHGWLMDPGNFHYFTPPCTVFIIFFFIFLFSNHTS
jgi:type 2A phosphatase activator TIP41